MVPQQRLKAVREESRAEVKVDKGTSPGADRLVTCASNEVPESEYCAAAGAMAALWACALPYFPKRHAHSGQFGHD